VSESIGMNKKIVKKRGLAADLQFSSTSRRAAIGTSLNPNRITPW